MINDELRRALRCASIAVVLVLNACAAQTGSRPAESDDQHLKDLLAEKDRIAAAGLISGKWVGASRCQAPGGYKSTRRYPIEMDLRHRGHEKYEGEMRIRGIAENRGVLTQLETFGVALSGESGEYRIRTKIFMPFLKSLVRISLDNDARITRLDFSTIQRCRSFTLARPS